MAFRVVAFICLLTLLGCRSGSSGPDARKAAVPFDNDSTLIFNGTTLDGWEVTNFGPQGPVSVSGGEIMLGMGDGCTGITYTRDIPLTDYEITLEARRKEGNDFFCGLTFPVGNDFCTLIAGGWGGTTVGLSCIDGKDASENETSVMRNFDKNRWYTIRLLVTGSRIEAWIDEEKVVDMETKGRRISIRPEVNLSKPLGIASWNTTAGIRNIRLVNNSREE
jgi:hypothetical protein